MARLDSAWAGVSYGMYQVLHDTNNVTDTVTAHDTIFTVSDELSLESPIKSLLNVLLQSLVSIPQVYQSIFQINRAEIASHSAKPPPKRKTVYSEPCHVLHGEYCPDASRMFTLKYRVRRDLNTAVLDH